MIVQDTQQTVNKNIVDGIINKFNVLEHLVQCHLIQSVKHVKIQS